MPSQSVPAFVSNGTVGRLSFLRFGCRVAIQNQRRVPRTVWRSLHVNVVSVGRASQKEAWAEIPVEEYQTRLKGSNAIDLELTYVRDNDALLRLLRNGQKKRLGCVIAMDEHCSAPSSSEKFADQLYTWLEIGGSRSTFVVGGAEGLPDEIKSEQYLPVSQRILAHHFLSLSPLTLTHKIARLVLVEQIYRAAEIRKGSKYNK